MSWDGSPAVETARVVVFVALVGAVFVGAAFVLLRRFVLLERRPPGPFGRAVVALAAVGVLCLLYGRYVEPDWIEVTTTRVPTSRLPSGHRGVRIVHLSDLHSMPTPRLELRLPAIVRELRPDLIVFTGDSANSREAVPTFRACLAELARSAPTFAVKGNWDVWYFPEEERFAGTGATELDGVAADVSVDGAKVHVIGAGFQSRLGRIGPALAALPTDGPAIVLYHPPYPDVVPAPWARRVDLMCAGHVHGGQVALPLYGALLTLSKYGKKYERGLYRTDEGFPMYVSRGVGLEGGSAPRVRFCARPEVALIELVPASSSSDEPGRPPGHPTGNDQSSSPSTNQPPSSRSRNSR